MKARATTDRRTRERILDTATELFSTQGFKHVTIREISREARVNVAAVNYHFGGKMDLYTDVVRRAVEIMRDATEEAVQAGRGLPAEERLREYIRVLCERMYAHQGASWLQQLMLREMNDPTDGLATIVNDGLRPRFEYLATIVRDLLGPEADDERVTQCTVSVHAQVVHFRPSPVLDHLPRKARRAFEVHHVIEHVTRFSLAGIAAYSAEAHRSRRASARRSASS